MNEPKLFSVVLAALAATGCFALAQALRLPRDSEWIRPYLTSLGMIFSCLALALAAIYLLWWLSAIVEKMRLAVAAPELERLAVISHMNEQQLAFARIDVQGIIEAGDDGELEWFYNTRWGSIPGAWLQSYLVEEAFKTYPQLSPIRMFSEGSVERKNREAFTRWMVNWRLLEQRPGEKFVWLADQATILERIGV